MEYGRQENWSDKMAEFDLTLERPGKWTLQAPWVIPAKGYWYGRQKDALSAAMGRLSQGYGTVIVRLHNSWGVPGVRP